MCPLSLVISHLSSEVAAAAAAAVVTRNDEIWGANRRRDQSASPKSASVFGRRDDQGEAGARGVMVPRERGGRASTNLESVNGPNGAIARQ